MTILYAIGSALAFAVIFLLRRQAGKVLPAPVSVGIEALVAFIILLVTSLILFHRPEKFPALSKEGISIAVLAGVVYAIGVVLNVMALRSDSFARIVTITSPSQIMFAILIGMLVLGERLNAVQYAGVAFCIIGIFLLTR